jgi:hypothetical protein
MKIVNGCDHRILKEIQSIEHGIRRNVPRLSIHESCEVFAVDLDRSLLEEAKIYPNTTNLIVSNYRGRSDPHE